MSKLSIFDHFLSVGNLKPKLEWFFKPQLKPKCFLSNWAPGVHEFELGHLKLAVGDWPVGPLVLHVVHFVSEAAYV